MFCLIVLCIVDTIFYWVIIYYGITFYQTVLCCMLCNIVWHIITYIACIILHVLFYIILYQKYCAVSYWTTSYHITCLRLQASVQHLQHEYSVFKKWSENKHNLMYFIALLKTLLSILDILLVGLMQWLEKICECLS